MSPSLVSKPGERLSSKAVEALPPKFHQARLREFVDFSRLMNGAQLTTPNHVRGQLVGGRPLRVREILGLQEPTPAYWTVEKASEAFRDRLPSGYVPVAVTMSDDFYCLDESGRVRLLMHDGWEGESDFPEVAPTFNQFIESIQGD
jgi:hypothetical protein